MCLEKKKTSEGAWFFPLLPTAPQMPNKEHPTLGLNGPGPGDAACFPPEGAPWLVLVAWWVVKRPRVPTSRLGARTPPGLCWSEYSPNAIQCRSKGLGWLALERVLFLGSIINEYTLQYGSWYSLEITPQLMVVIHPHKLFKSTYPHCCTAVRRASVWIDIRLLLVLKFFFQFSCLILLE